MNKSPAVFDMSKLRWMNGEYIKGRDEDHKDLDLKKIASQVKTRIEVFPEIKELIDFYEEVPGDTQVRQQRKLLCLETICLSSAMMTSPSIVFAVQSRRLC